MVMNHAPAYECEEPESGFNLLVWDPKSEVCETGRASLRHASDVGQGLCKGAWRAGGEEGLVG